MRVLLTGAAGFIGSAVAELLRDRGDEVVAVDLMVPQAHGDAAPLPDVRRLDVREAADWAPLLEGVDAVCHQAALVGAGADVADLPAYASHNDLGTAALLAAMHAAGVDRMVLASSMVVYGEGRYACPTHGVQTPPARRPADLEAGDFDHHCQECSAPLPWHTVGEETPLDPRSTYAASKVAQEHYAAAWARLTGGRVAALRYHNVYGPGMPRDTPYSGVAALFRSSLARGEPPQVFEDGRQARDFVHVADVARANLAAVDAVSADRPDPGTLRAYNVCSGRPIRIGEVAEILAAAAGGPDAVVTGGFRLGDVRHVVADPVRACAELGFTARVPPEEGLVGFATAPLRG